jgi:hypothetical protein
MKLLPFRCVHVNSLMLSAFERLVCFGTICLVAVYHHHWFAELFVQPLLCLRIQTLECHIHDVGARCSDLRSIVGLAPLPAAQSAQAMSTINMCI